MNAIVDALKSAGRYILTDHAKERIRQRVGITSEEAAISWIASQVQVASSKKQVGNKTHYMTDIFEIILDGVKIITVKQAESSNEYLTKFNEVLAKEAVKLISTYSRTLRKAEIAVAEAQLNFLRAKNPKTKALISERLTEATDWKCTVEDEIKAIKKAAKQYGVEV